MAQVKRKKNITMGDLAAMVARGFKGQNKKFDKRFDVVDQKLTQHDVRFDRLEKKVDDLKKV